jgi:Spy/CpxP family protein refolding chaperone
MPTDNLPLSPKRGSNQLQLTENKTIMKHITLTDEQAAQLLQLIQQHVRSLRRNANSRGYDKEAYNKHADQWEIIQNEIAIARN